MTVGYDKPLYVLPFDHRATFSKNMFGRQGPLSSEQTAEIAAAKQKTNVDVKRARLIQSKLAAADNRAEDRS